MCQESAGHTGTCPGQRPIHLLVILEQFNLKWTESYRPLDLLLFPQPCNQWEMSPGLQGPSQGGPGSGRGLETIVSTQRLPGIC